MRRRFSTLQRWPMMALNEPAPGWRGWPRRFVVGAAAPVPLAAVGAVLLPWFAGAALLAAAVAVSTWLFYRRIARARDAESRAYVVADADGLARVTLDVTKMVVKWDEPFGVALLASYGRPTALLAFTTPSQTRYLPARIDGRSDGDDELLARIAVLADLDLVDGIAHDAALTPASAAAILREVEKHDKGALGRVFLSDGRGQPIALDRATLSVGDRTFDMTSALEWRPLMFHESTGQAAALYQATWIRQGTAEVVLVAPMPASIVPREPSAHREASGKLGRALTRDLRLLQAPAESPPARDVRVAIDRPFMMAVRRVLDDAPLALRSAETPADAADAAESRKPETRRDSVI